MLAAELDDLLKEIEEVSVFLQIVPIKPTDFVVLAVGIVIAEL